MAKKEHGQLYKSAQAELQRAGLAPDGKGEAGLSIYHTTLKLVDLFEKGSVSDLTGPIIKNLFFVLSDGELINDVTNDPNEWNDLGGTTLPAQWQNTRNPKIYSTDLGKTWIRFSGDGRQNGISKDVSKPQEESTNGSEA